LLSNSSKELKHLREDVSETELKMLIKECGFFDDDDDDEEEEDDNLNKASTSISSPSLPEVYDLDIPTHEVRVLIINDMLDLNNHVFTGEFEGEHDDASDDDEVSEVLDEELDFELIDKISAPANMGDNK